MISLLENKVMKLGGQLYDLCLKVLDVVYMNHDIIYRELFTIGTGRENMTRKDQ